MLNPMLIGDSNRIVVPGGLVARGRIIEVHPRKPVIRRFTEDEALELAIQLSESGKKGEAEKYLNLYLANNTRMSH